MSRLVLRCYPRSWRERYGEEFAALLDDLAAEPRALGRLVSVLVGAWDAHWHRGRTVMARFLDQPSRRGVWVGLAATAVLAVIVVLTNVVFPPGPNDSDSDPGYLVQLLIAYLLVIALLIAVGWYARRHSDSRFAGAKSGAAAALVIAVGLTATFIIVNNLFFDIVSQQQDKRVAFAASGWSSMRAYITVRQALGLVVLAPVVTAVGAVLGFVGGKLPSPRRSRA